MAIYPFLPLQIQTMCLPDWPHLLVNTWGNSPKTCQWQEMIYPSLSQGLQEGNPRMTSAKQLVSPNTSFPLISIKLFLKFIIRPFILGRINFKWFWIATTMRNINPGNKSLKFSQYSLDYSSLYSIYCSSEEIFSQESKYRIPYQYQNSYHEQDYTTVFLILSPQI